MKGARCVQGIAHLQHQGMGNRPRRSDAKHVRAQDNGDAVTAANISAAIHHGRNGRMHATRPEMNQWFLTHQCSQSGSLGRHPGSLAQETQQRCFVQTKIKVTAFNA